MRFLIVCGLALALGTLSLRADWVLVQKVEGAGKSGEATIRIQAGKIRADVTPAMSVITDTLSGEVILLMHEKKVYLRLEGEAVKQLLQRAQAQAEAIQPASPEPKLQPTGKHETVNGQETELFTTQSGSLKARYWIAKDYPGQASLMEVLKAIKATPLSQLARQMAPQPVEFPGIPVKTELEISKTQKLTSTLVSAREEPVEGGIFIIPADYTAQAAPIFGEAGLKK